MASVTNILLEGRMSLAAALEQYERERGFKSALPIYHSTNESNLRLRDFVLSHKSKYLSQGSHFLQLEVWNESDHSDRRILYLTVISIESIWMPNEDESTDDKIIYNDAPEWVGEAFVWNYDPTAGYTFSNRVRYVLEIDNNEGTIFNASIQAIDA